jgi:hypothetical protein
MHCLETSLSLKTTLVSKANLGMRGNRLPYWRESFAPLARRGRHSHAGAWERENRLVPYWRESFAPLARRGRHSHAGAWEREIEIKPARS